MESRLTHVAFQVTDVERTVDFYARYTRLRVVHERPDRGRGSRVVWLREPDGGSSLTLVIFEGDLPAKRNSDSLHHLGFAVESRDAVEEIARRGREEGILVVEPSDLGEVVGYICTIADPDGNVLEFSHGQEL
jgi:catechol 2,3-dioxygenase-like lactoylglutathione lyase family enzyme